MKYILLLTGTKADFEEFAKWPKQDLHAHLDFMHALNKELKDSGAFVAAEGLDWYDQAKIVRAGNDGEPVTDGIFPESKEFLAGYWIVDVENAEQAYRIAARASMAPAPGWAKRGRLPVEVRQIMSKPPDWM
jgi:hypothetical protein